MDSVFVRERITALRMQKGVSEYQMSYDLGHSRGYINNISSLAELFAICDYLNITPQEFFNTDATAPQKSKELLREIERLTPEQTDHIMLVIRDLIKCQ